MLTGPTGSNDYFNSDHHFAGSFPTPNESSLRTGLTPGGGGSMFPQPSPNSQALYNQLQSGGATPGTLDFHRTAMTARAQSQANTYTIPQNGATSQPQQNPNIQPDLDAKPFPLGAPNQQQDHQDPFGSHQTNDAANGLFMLAQAGGQRGAQQGFAMPQQPQQNYQQNMQQDVSMHKRQNKNSIGSTMSGSTENGQGDYSDGSTEAKPQTKSGRGKKGGSNGKAGNGKRKAEETPSKAGNKKQRGNSGHSMPSEEPEDMMDEQGMDDMDDTNADGKKMTDEEKRKNFLERNRYVCVSVLHVHNPHTDPYTESPLSSADSARSNGLQTCSRRWRSSVRRTMHSPPPSLSFEKRSSDSRPCCLRTRTVPCRKRKAFPAWRCSRSLVITRTMPIHMAWRWGRVVYNKRRCSSRLTCRGGEPTSASLDVCTKSLTRWRS